MDTSGPLNAADEAEFSAAIVEAIWGVLPGYNREHMTREDLERFARPHIRIILQALAERRGPSQEEPSYAVELGTSRALQGVPLDSIVQAFHVAERTIVNALLARIDSAADARRLVDVLGRAVDDLREASVAAYRRARDEITVHYERLESDLVAQLSATDRASPEVAAQARLVGADPDSPHIAVAAVRLGDHRPASTLRVRRQLLASVGDLASGRILAGTKGVHALLVVPCEHDEQRVRSVLGNAIIEPALRKAVVGVGERAPTMATVGRSCRQAVIATDVGQVLRRPGAVVPYETVVPEALFLGDRTAARRLVDEALGPLTRQPRLLATLRAYITSDTSNKVTATRLGVHPNTVAYRLRKIQSLTRRDLRSTADICECALALRALDMLTGESAVSTQAEGQA